MKTAEEYFEMATANTKETRPTICADECLALMRDYASGVAKEQRWAASLWAEDSSILEMPLVTDKQ